MPTTAKTLSNQKTPTMHTDHEYPIGPEPEAPRFTPEICAAFSPAPGSPRVVLMRIRRNETRDSPPLYARVRRASASSWLMPARWSSSIDFVRTTQEATHFGPELEHFLEYLAPSSPFYRGPCDWERVVLASPEVDGLPLNPRPDESKELLANPEFAAHLARMNAGAVKYTEGTDLPA